MKQSKHAWLIWGIVLVVVLTLMIIIPFTRTATWWIAAVCTLAMFALCAYVFGRAFGQNNKLESKLLGWPLFRVAYTALIAQIVTGFVLMAIAFICPAWIAIIAEMLLFAFYGISMTVKDAAREIVIQSESKIADRTSGWKAIRAAATALASSGSNPQIKKLAEEIRFADPTPTSMDSEIAQMLETLKTEPSDENVRQALSLVLQRKAIAKEQK